MVSNYEASYFIQDELSNHTEYYNKEKQNKINTFRCPICYQICKINLSYSNKNTIIKYECESQHKNSLNLQNFLKETREFNIYSAVCSENINHNSNGEFNFCFDCKKFFCPNCISSNHKNHKYINVSKFDSTCSLHLSKFEYFCEKCQKNLCRECHRKHNKEHNCFPINPINNNIIDKLINDLNSSKKFLDEVKKKFNEVKKEIEEKLNSIQSSFNKFNEINNNEITLFETLLKTYQDNSKDNLNYIMIKNITSIVDINRFEIDFVNSNDLGRNILSLINYLENTNNYILKAQVQFKFNEKIIKQDYFILSAIGLKDGRFVTSNTNGNIIIYNEKNNFEEQIKIKIHNENNGYEGEYGMCLTQLNDLLLVGTNIGKMKVYFLYENSYSEFDSYNCNEKGKIYKILNLENNQILIGMENGKIYILELKNQASFETINYFHIPSNLINALYLSNNKFCIITIENKIKILSFYDLNGNFIAKISNISSSSWFGNLVKIDDNKIGIVGAKFTIIDTNNHIIIGNPQDSNNFMTIYKMRNGDYLSGGINNLLLFTIVNNKYVQKYYFSEVFDEKTSKITQIVEINGKILLCSSNGDIKILE